jgi:hypothetical protein
MPEYRRRMFGADEKAWHWRQECSSWPIEWYESRICRPDDGMPCEECAHIAAEVDAARRGDLAFSSAFPGSAVFPRRAD